MAFSIAQAAKAARVASRQVAKLSATQKETLLKDIAERMLEQSAEIMVANQQDLAAGRENNLDDAMLDRLLLNAERIQGIANAVLDIAAQADPVGSIEHMQQMPSGIQVGKMRIPLGVIAMIYESRPNVTIDAAALCLKAGNAVVLRGGKEALHSNLALAECISFALDKNGIDPAAVVVVPNPDRAVMNELMTLNEDIDLIIPRGGEGLIRFVSENSRIPVIQHYKGVCHLYVDKDADLEIALNLLLNGKTQRTGVCNALEGLVVHQDVADEFLNLCAVVLRQEGVKINADSTAAKYFDDATVLADNEFGEEYLDLEIAIRVVPTFSAAVDHIAQFGSNHTEVICTKNDTTAELFQRSVDASVVMVNASSRFSDGSQLGLGAEIGIATTKLHAYGPMGLESLTTEKYLVNGVGQVRE